MGAALSLTVSVGIPLVGGFVGGLLTKDEVKGWYKSLKKPKWTPPNWLFGPMWTVLYTTQGLAAWFVWRQRVAGKVVTPLVLYGVQMALNLAYTPLLFKTHKTDVALADITALLGVATAATVTMAKADSAARQLPLMLPYLAWASFAAALTAKICVDNPTERLIQLPAKKEEDKKADGPSGLLATAAAAAEEVKTATAKAVEAASSAVQAVTAGMAAAKAAKEVKETLTGSSAPEPAPTATSGVSKLADGAVELAAATKQTVQDAVTGAAKATGDTLSGAAKATGDALTGAAKSADEARQEATGEVAKAVKETLAEASAVAEDVKSGTQQAATGAVDAAKSLFKDTTQPTTPPQ